jgi:hypothetical protein
MHHVLLGIVGLWNVVPKVSIFQREILSQKLLTSVGIPLSDALMGYYDGLQAVQRYYWSSVKHFVRIFKSSNVGVESIDP